MLSLVHWHSKLIKYTSVDMHIDLQSNRSQNPNMPISMVDTPMIRFQHVKEKYRDNVTYRNFTIQKQ
jgi:hypothetical protein